MSSENASDVLLCSDSEGVRVLTIDRPDAMNALNGELVRRLGESFGSASHDGEVRVVILTGAGDRAFCAGADLKERRDMSEEDVARRLEEYRRTWRAVEQCSKPVICAINGYAFGGGLELALACDLRVVAEETKVGLTETRLGIIPGAGGTQRLPRLVGVSRAKELIFTARRLSGREALEYGVVNDCVPRAALNDRVRELAAEIAKAAPVALAQAKRAIDAGMQADLETGLDVEAQCYAVTIPTEDRREGLEAFAQKREPEWTGR